MSRTTLIGIFGGVLIALSVFFTSTAIAFDGGALSGAVALVTFLLGLAIVVLLAVGLAYWALLATAGAVTIALIGLIDVFRGDGPGLTVGFVVLLVGAGAAVFGTSAYDQSAYNAPARKTRKR